MAAAFRESQRTEKAVQPTAAATAGGGQAEEELDPSVVPRTQGPIATGCSCLEMTSAVPDLSIDHAVWVPAFAGTTCGERPAHHAHVAASRQSGITIAQ